MTVDPGMDSVDYSLKTSLGFDEPVDIGVRGDVNQCPELKYPHCEISAHELILTDADLFQLHERQFKAHVKAKHTYLRFSLEAYRKAWSLHFYGMFNPHMLKFKILHFIYLFEGTFPTIACIDLTS